jgi:hypothetical protein
MERAGIDFRPSAFLKVQAAIILRMGNRVFFSFHYQDVIEFRANVVRNHWVAKPNRTAAGFYDASLWEDTKKQGKTALKRLINSGVDNTSNTCVLIGSSTYARPWVRYELLKSFKRGNHIFGVLINGIRAISRVQVRVQTSVRTNFGKLR